MQQPTHNGQCTNQLLLYNVPLLCGFNVPLKDQRLHPCSANMFDVQSPQRDSLGKRGNVKWHGNVDSTIQRDVLHWLLVPQQIQFKIAISAFDCVREHCPAYFNNVSIPVAGISGQANLRSAERHDMFVPSTRTQLDRRSFHVAASTVWNALPSQLRSSSISLDSLELGWKLISPHRPTDTSENLCWRAYCFTLYYK